MGRVGSGGVILRGGLNIFKVKCGAYSCVASLALTATYSQYHARTQKDTTKCNCWRHIVTQASLPFSLSYSIPPSLLPSGNAQVTCSSSSLTCDGTIGNPPTARDCCLGTGMSYNAGSGCQICVGKTVLMYNIIITLLLLLLLLLLLPLPLPLPQPRFCV